MARVGKFLHHSEVVGIQAVTTGFSTSVKHDHTLVSPNRGSNGHYFGIVNGIEILLTAATSATTVTVRLCKDAGGDIVIVPDVTATLVGGVSTPATKSAVFRVDMPIRQDLAPTPNNTLYLFVKVDDATSNPTFTGSQIVWQE